MWNSGAGLSCVALPAAREREFLCGLAVMKRLFANMVKRRKHGVAVTPSRTRDGAPSDAEFRDLVGAASQCAQAILPPGYLKSFVEPDQMRAQVAYYRHALCSMWERFECTDGLDLGCWYGFSTLIIAGFGPRTVTGTDPRREFIDAALKWSAGMDLPALQFSHLDMGTAPVAQGSCDWVVVNQVLCNAMPDSFRNSLRLGWQALGEGGLLLVSDSNNPHCPATIERLLRTYRALEIGGGSLGGPDGPNHRARRERIRNLAPDLPEEELDSLARCTCYLGGAALEEAVRGYRTSGVAPQSYFVESVGNTPCNPINGAALGNVTDPYQIAQFLEELGGRVWITVAGGGEPLDSAELAVSLSDSQGFHVYARKAKG